MSHILGLQSSTLNKQTKNHCHYRVSKDVTFVEYWNHSETDRQEAQLCDRRFYVTFSKQFHPKGGNTKRKGDILFCYPVLP